MESKQIPSNKKLISIKEEKILHEFDYDSTTDAYTCFPKKHLILKILQKGTNFRQSSPKVLVSITSKTQPIKTLYIAEKSRFYSKRSSDKSGSSLAIGDHSSFVTHFSEDNLSIRNPVTHGTLQHTTHPENYLISEKYLSRHTQFESSKRSSKSPFNNNTLSRGVCKKSPKQKSKKCLKVVQTDLTMNSSKVIPKTEKDNTKPNKVDIATLVVTDTHSKDIFPTFSGALYQLHRRIDHLERKILRQEMAFRSLDDNIHVSSSDEEMKNPKNDIMRSSSGMSRPGCSYIEQYSHIPGTSAFQRYSTQGTPGSKRKATTLEKEHNSEQYGRDFTTYDGITTRARRQCASVPCKRDEIPKVAAERVHKIRQKLNPVRDYRLMDTVHYLAQGEFAPRDDGIKLTPSREAVLSDIIWEDVCRTHWPNTRLGRRVTQSDRYNTRGELQRLIDNLLRERVAHVERRKRRHYRVVKLNNRHENCRAVGKTGDIIVASHKSKENSSRDLVLNDHKATSTIMTHHHRGNKDKRKNYKSYERLIIPGMSPTNKIHEENCSPGPSCAAYSISKRATTNCYQTSATSNNQRITIPSSPGSNEIQDLTSISSMSAYKAACRRPRLVVKKENPRHKTSSKEEANLEHFIILPTLVVRTPSNMKRQKKFSELYHRILNVHMNEAYNNIHEVDSPKEEENLTPNKKDVGFNINITLSDSEENIKGK